MLDEELCRRTIALALCATVFYLAMTDFALTPDDSYMESELLGRARRLGPTSSAPLGHGLDCVWLRFGVDGLRGSELSCVQLPNGKRWGLAFR